MADVYMLASPPPTLFIYPSAPHPQVDEPVFLSGPIWEPGHRHRPKRPQQDGLQPPKRRRDEDALTVLGAI